MKHKVSHLVAFLLCLSLLFTGCGSAARPDAQNPVTLNLWHNYGGDMQQTMDELIDEFNSTVGKEQGIIINVSAIASSAELNKNLAMILNDDPGAPDMPDLCTAYPKVAIGFQQKGLLANLENYMIKEEASAYVPAFWEEGRFGDGGLYVFPMAKSTEILYLNQTLFDRFAAATGAKLEQLSTFEGISELARLYYDWTDGMTPNVPNDGKQFFAADSWFNVAEVVMKQLGGDLIQPMADGEGYKLSFDGYSPVFELFYAPAVLGGFAIYDGYSSDLSKTGDLVCSTGSSAGILFYGDTITYPDNRVETVEYSILPYPVMEGGEKVAIQRGGGFMVAKSDTIKEYAAIVFLKWITAPDQNMRFISSTGYLPVTKQAFEEEMKAHIEKVTDVRIQKMLSAVTDMYQSYRFFTPPIFEKFDAMGKSYETKFKALMTAERERVLAGGAPSAAEAEAMMKD